MTYEKLYYVLDNVEVDSKDKDLVEALGAMRMALLTAINNKEKEPEGDICIKIYDATGVCDCSECTIEAKRFNNPSGIISLKDACKKIKDLIYGK